LTTNILYRLLLKRIYVISNLQAICETSRTSTEKNIDWNIVRGIKIFPNLYITYIYLIINNTYIIYEYLY